jgi:signal transduction histidine kinase
VVWATGWPMADAAPLIPAQPAAADSAERTASEADARLVRGVRWRLVAWSGGSTLIVLLALGIALYAAVANTLAAASTSQLEARTDPWVAALQGQPDPDQPPPGFGFQPGRGNTFLFAFDSHGKTVQLGREPVVALSGMPETESLEAARAATDGRSIWAGQLDIQATTIPVRILTQRVTYRADGQTYFLQALQDRSTEVGTLNALVTVLLVGGLVVVLVAVGFGAFYARRALVPIRDSLVGQRTALRRQREFAADASHELRTPLTVIRASVAHLRRHGDRPVNEVGEALVDIDAEIEHLTMLVEDLLLLARSDSGAVTLERVPLHLDDIATDAASALAQPAAAAGVRLEVDPTPTTAVGDPARLRQLVTILVDNAIRHSPRGSAVRVLVRPDAGSATVAVEDSGPGVAPEDRPRVFDRFWRAPGAPAGGTGLGLAIAKWIAEHHDGTISVDRSEAGGARFEVRIPSPPILPVPEATT